MASPEQFYAQWESFITNYMLCSRRLFALDYDGTLTGIVNDPDSATPSPRLVSLLEKLCSNNKNTVWIISGRGQSFLEQHLGGIRGLGLCAEHGCILRYPCRREWHTLGTPDLSWKDTVMKVFQEYCVLMPKSTIENKKLTVVWHYRNCDPSWGAVRGAQCYEELKHALVDNPFVTVMEGKANVEVRPTMANKGKVVAGLARGFDPLCGPHDADPIAPDYVLCAGDDTTDEDMFCALETTCSLPKENVCTWHVEGDGKDDRKLTRAKWRIPSPFATLSVLEVLAQIDGFAFSVSKPF